jgi:hypothetical protein
MTHQGSAPTRKNIKVKITDNIPSQDPAVADAGNTIEFVNMDLTEKVLRFKVEEDGTEYHPIGLIIPPGPESFAQIVAVNPENGKPSSNVFYSIKTAKSDGKLGGDPDDDTYQVIVGSSSNEK